MPSVGLHVPPEGGDLVHLPVAIEDADRTEVDPHRNSPPVPEQLSHLFWFCRGRQIPIEVRVTEEGVVHSATDAPRLETGILQPIGDLEHSRWRIQAHFEVRKDDRWYTLASLATRVKMASHYNLGHFSAILLFVR